MQVAKIIKVIMVLVIAIWPVYFALQMMLEFQNSMESIIIGLALLSLYSFAIIIANLEFVEKRSVTFEIDGDPSGLVTVTRVGDYYTCTCNTPRYCDEGHCTHIDTAIDDGLI